MATKVKITMLVLTVLACSFFSPMLIAGESSATDPDSKLQNLPDGVSIHMLDNGMQVLLIENQALPMVGVNVVVKVGSAYETFATSGMSHMLEHLLFNGTTSRKQKQLYDDVDRIGGYNNANTSEYYTNYMMVTPAEHILAGMEIQADMLFNSVLPENKFKKEKGIVLEEISKSLANPRAQLERNVISIIYPGHALSLPTLGTYATIEGMDRDEVLEFYLNNYVPNNMILSAIGNFNSAEMLKSIKEIYGSAKPGKVQRESNPEWLMGFQANTLKNAKPDMAYHRFYDGKFPVIQMLYPIPPATSSHLYDLIDVVLRNKVDEVKEAVKAEFADQYKSLDISARPSPLSSYVEISVTLKEAVDFDKLKNTVAKKLGKMDLTMSQDEISSQVTKARTSFLKNIEKPHMFGIFNANEFAVNGIEAVLSSYSGAELLKASNQLKHLKFNTEPIIIIQHPDIKNEDESETSAGNTKLFENGKAGPSVIAVQNSASNLLAVHYMIKHKAALESEYGKDAAKILHDAIGQRLKADKANSSPFGFTYVVNDNPYIPMDDIYMHPDYGYIRVEGLADDLTGAINYLNAILKDFVPTEAEFQKASGKFGRSGGPMAMMGGGDKAKELFNKTYKSLIYNADKYKEGPELTHDNLLTFTKVYLNPANMIIAVVSPGDPQTVNNLYSNFSGESVTAETPASVKTLKLQTKPEKIENDGGGQRSYLFWGFTKSIDKKDKAALTALSLVLADEIIFDIREKQGMAYHMKAGIKIAGDKALFYINQGTRPENVEVLVPQYPGFFELKKLEALKQPDIEKSVNMYLGRMMFRRLSSINQAYYLSHSLYFHNDINYDKDFLKQLSKVTLEDVQQVAQKYMKMENPVSIIIH